MQKTLSEYINTVFSRKKSSLRTINNQSSWKNLFLQLFFWETGQLFSLQRAVLRKEEAAVTAKLISHPLSSSFLLIRARLDNPDTLISSERSPPAHGCIHTARVYLLCSILPCICNERGSSGNQNRAAIFLLTRISWHQKHTEALMWERGDAQEYNRLAGTQIWEQEQTISPPARHEEENGGCVVLPVSQLSKPNGSVF